MIVCLYFVVVIISIVCLIKNEVTFYHRQIINEAIFQYHMDLIRKHEYDFLVDWVDIESYDSTLFRLWDWGYTRILPPEKYEIIKPYIAKAKGGKK